MLLWLSLTSPAYKAPAQFCRRLTGWVVQRLSRVPVSGEFIPEVDGIRFLAILAVLVFHSAVDIYIARGTDLATWAEHHGAIVRVMGSGWFGVEIFFVLSGFIVALPFARHELRGAPAPDLARYFLRRLTRIEPPYVLSLTAMYLISRHLRSFLPDFLAALFYSHQYVFGTSTPFAIITWSLEVEVSFYILAPWLSLLYRIKDNGLRWLWQIILIGSSSIFANNWLGPHGPAWIQHTLAVMIPYFLAGMLLADLYALGLVPRSSQIGWDLATAGALLGIRYSMVSNLSWMTPLMILLLVAGVIRGRVANWFFRLRPVTLMGGMCYTLYLWHGPILILLPAGLKQLVNRLSYTNAALVYCSVAIPITIAACVPIFLLIEKPFMNGPGSRFIESQLRSISQPFRGSKPVAPDVAASV